jgi:hypothetical protein
VEAIDNNALRVEEAIPPTLEVITQEFFLWTPNQVHDFGRVDFTKKPKVDEGWAVLQTQWPRLGEKKQSKMFIGTDEVTWTQLPGD